MQLTTTEKKEIERNLKELSSDVDRAFPFNDILIEKKKKNYFIFVWKWLLFVWKWLLYDSFGRKAKRQMRNLNKLLEYKETINPRIKNVVLSNEIEFKKEEIDINNVKFEEKICIHCHGTGKVLK